MSILPIGDRLLVKPKNPEEKTKGGILLTKKEEEKQSEGIVVAIGEGENVKVFKKGEKIIYLKYGPQEITIDKVKYVIVCYDELLGVER